MRNAPTPTRWIPALGHVYDGLAPLAYPLIRITAGAVLIPHGWGKVVGGGVDGTAQYMASQGLEPAYALAMYIGLLELVGGILIAIGFLTRLAAIQVAGFMAVAAFVVHWGNGFFWNAGGFEYPLFWGMVMLAITIRGGGQLSVDHAIGKEI